MRSRKPCAVGADGSTSLSGLLLAAAGAGLLVAMVFVLRSSRAGRVLYGLDTRLRSIGGLDPAEPLAFSRRFEIGVYCSMCLGLGLVFLGLVVAVA